MYSFIKKDSEGLVDKVVHCSEDQELVRFLTKQGYELDNFLPAPEADQVSEEVEEVVAPAPKPRKKAVAKPVPEVVPETEPELKVEGPKKEKKPRSRKA